MLQHNSTSLPTTLLVLIALNWCISLVSLFIWIELLADPTGATLWLPPVRMLSSPFPDYTLPGFVLFFVVVLPTFIAGLSLATRWKFAGQASLFAGAMLWFFGALDWFWLGAWGTRVLVFAFAGFLQVALSIRALARAAR